MAVRVRTPRLRLDTSTPPRLHYIHMQTPLGPALLQAVPRDGLSVAADISIVIVAVAVVVLTIVTTFLLLRVNRVVGQVGGSVRQNLGPVSERARGIAENVEVITRTLRGDVERLNESVTSVTDGLKLASQRMEERIEDFNALMEVVQEEAEDVFIDTAATVRGVREGARSITGGIRRARVDEEPAGELDAPGEPDALPETEAADYASTADPKSERAGALAADGG